MDESTQNFTFTPQRKVETIAIIYIRCYLRPNTQQLQHHVRLSTSTHSHKQLTHKGLKIGTDFLKPLRTVTTC